MYHSYDIKFMYFYIFVSAEFVIFNLLKCNVLSLTLRRLVSFKHIIGWHYIYEREFWFYHFHRATHQKLTISLLRQKRYFDYNSVLHCILSFMIIFLFYMNQYSFILLLNNHLYIKHNEMYTFLVTETVLLNEK